MALWTPTVFSIAVATSTWLSSISLIGLVGRPSHISFLTTRRNTCIGGMGHRKSSSFSFGGRWEKRRSSNKIAAVALDKEPPPSHRVSVIPGLYRNSSHGRGRFLRPPPKFTPKPFEYLQGTCFGCVGFGH